MRPKVYYPRPPHPPPDPPIPEASITGHLEPRPPLLAPHLAQSDLEHPKQRHSYPERLVRSRSTDVVSAGRRPNSDPGLNRRTMMEEREPAGAYSTGPTSSPSKDSLKGEVGKMYLSIISIIYLDDLHYFINIIALLMVFCFNIII